METVLNLLGPPVVLFGMSCHAVIFLAISGLILTYVGALSAPKNLTLSILSVICFALAGGLAWVNQFIFKQWPLPGTADGAMPTPIPMIDYPTLMLALAIASGVVALFILLNLIPARPIQVLSLVVALLGSLLVAAGMVVMVYAAFPTLYPEATVVLPGEVPAEEAEPAEPAEEEPADEEPAEDESAETEEPSAEEPQPTGPEAPEATETPAEQEAEEAPASGESEADAPESTTEQPAEQPAESPEGEAPEEEDELLPDLAPTQDTGDEGAEATGTETGGEGTDAEDESAQEDQGGTAADTSPEQS